MIKYFLLFLLLIFIWFFFSFKITEVPPAINGDEVQIGYNALLISDTLHDETGRFLPLFTSTGNGEYKQPVTVYATAAAFKLFGQSYELLRQVSVFFVIISLIPIFFLLKEIFNTKLAFLGSIIFLTIPAVLIQSHLALENIASVPFTAFWLLMLVKFQKNGWIWLLFFAGISVGISFYSYLGMRLMVPVIIIITIFYILYLKRGNFLRYSLVFILGLLPFLVSLPFVHQQYPGAILANNRPSLPQSYQELLMPYISIFDFSFLFITGDSTPYHSTGKHGMFLLVTLPLFLIGCYDAIRKRNSLLLLTLITFFALPTLYVLIPAIHRSSRLLALIPFFVILSTLGFKTLLEMNPKFLRILGIFLISFLFLTSYYDFTIDYWFHYPGRVKPAFPGAAHIAFAELNKASGNLNLTPVVQRSIYGSELGAKFFGKVYFNGSLSTWDLGEEVPDNIALLAHQSDTQYLKDKGMSQLDVNLPYYAIYVKK